MSRTRVSQPSEVAALMGEAFGVAARHAVGRAVAAGVSPVGEGPAKRAPKPEPVRAVATPAPSAKKAEPKAPILKAVKTMPAPAKAPPLKVAAKAPPKAPIKKPPVPVKASAKAAPAKKAPAKAARK